MWLMMLSEGKFGKLCADPDFAANLLFLGACPRIGRGRVPGLEGADARRRDAGDVGAHRRGAPTKQMPLPSRNPKGAWGLHDDRCVARRRRCAWTSPPPRALRSPCKPHARDPFEFSDRLLACKSASDGLGDGQAISPILGVQCFQSGRSF